MPTFEFHRTPDNLSTESLFPTTKPDLGRRLHEFRVQYEALHGPTEDKPYTSQLSTDEQSRLFRESPEYYFAGWPEFALAYYQEILENLRSDGRLDEAPEEFIRVFTRNRGRLL